MAKALKNYAKQDLKVFALVQVCLILLLILLSSSAIAVTTDSKVLLVYIKWACSVSYNSSRFEWKFVTFFKYVNIRRFQANILFLHPLKTYESQRLWNIVLNVSRAVDCFKRSSCNAIYQNQLYLETLKIHFITCQKIWNFQKAEG